MSLAIVNKVRCVSNAMEPVPGKVYGPVAGLTLAINISLAQLHTSVKSEDTYAGQRRTTNGQVIK